LRKYEVVKEEDYSDFSNIGKPVIPKVAIATGVMTIMLPLTTFASGADETFGNIHTAVMTAFDAGVVLIIIFAGASWALGHRSKAIELIIGVCCGYALARHAFDIRDLLKRI
jgi:hypothetical protein